MGELFVSFQIFLHLFVELGDVFLVLSYSEDFVFLGGFGYGLVVGDGAFVGKDFAAVVVQEHVCLLQPVLHTHQNIVLGHEFGIVDEHRHQAVEAGQFE